MNSNNGTRDDTQQATSSEPKSWLEERRAEMPSKKELSRFWHDSLNDDLTPEERQSMNFENYRAAEEASLEKEKIKRGIPVDGTPANRKAGPPLLKDGVLLLSDLDLTAFAPQQWLVKHVIPDAGIGTIFGDSGTFKSFVALDMMAHVANGWTWMGKRVTRSPCVYVPLEGRGGIPKRVEAWRFATAIRNAAPSESNLGACYNFDMTTGIRFIMDPINLRDASDRATLVDALKGGELTGGVLCIDTLAQAGGGGVDENSSEGMGELIRIMQELQSALGGVVVAIHHTGKNLAAGMRGHSSLRGAIDFAVECSKPDGADKYAAQIRLDKVKDEEAGTVIPFTMQRVTLGVDDDGDHITSLVVAQGQLREEDAIPPQSASQTNADVDNFVWNWIKRENEEGLRPSARSLEAKLNEIRAQHSGITKRGDIRDAVERLVTTHRVRKEKHKGNQTWLHFIDVMPPAPSEQPKADS